MLLKALKNDKKTSPFLLCNPCAYGRGGGFVTLSDPRPTDSSPKQLVPILLHYSGYAPGRDNLIITKQL